MKEEQIRQNAEEYARQFLEPYDEEYAPIKHVTAQMAYIAGAHSRDEEISRMNVTMRLYANKIEQQRKEIDQLCHPWISVEERLPEECKDVFVRKTCTNGIFHLTGKVLNGGKWYCYGFGWQDSGVITHWMPIPELKKRE